MEELIKKCLLTEEQKGDNLVLEDEGTYRCSDGGIVATVSVDRLLKAQLEKAIPIIKKGSRDGTFQLY